MATTYPSYPGRTANLLDGLWDFCWLGDCDPEKVEPGELNFDRRMAVPGCYDTLPDLAGKRGCVALRTRLFCPENREGLICFKGLGLFATIWVDGVKVGTCQSPFSGVSFPVQPSAAPARELVVVLDNRFDRDRTPLVEPDFDFYCYGGIYRSVEWHVLPDNPIRRALVRTTDLDKGVISVRVLFQGEVSADAVVEARLNRGEWREVGTAGKGAEEFEFEEQADPGRIWSPEAPHLQLLEVRVGDDRVTERFGLRTIAVSGSDLLFNGKKLKLQGICRHEAHPEFGPALPDHVIIQDLIRLRSLGVNFVRGTHYPQDPRFLDLCDEMGMLVLEESLGWGAEESRLVDRTFGDLVEEQTVAMITNSYNHPSVIIWGFLNEADGASEKGDSLFTRLAGAVRDADPSRPLTYASKHPFNDRQFEMMDIISINTYPAWQTGEPGQSRPLGEIGEMLDEIRRHLSDEGCGEKPVFISEIGAGALYGWRDAHGAHWSEEYQRDFLLEAIDRMEAASWINGYCLRQYCDYRTVDSVLAIQHPRTFSNMGLCDEYRRPKLAWDAVRERLKRVQSISL